MHPYEFYCSPGRREISSILILVLYFILKQSYLDTISDIFSWSIPSTVFQLLLFFCQVAKQSHIFSKRQLEQDKGLAHFPFLLSAVPSSFQITGARITLRDRWIFTVLITRLSVTRDMGPLTQLCLFLQNSWRCDVFHLICCTVRRWLQVTFGGQVHAVDLKSAP